MESRRALCKCLGNSVTLGTRYSTSSWPSPGAQPGRCWLGADAWIGHPPPSCCCPTPTHMTRLPVCDAKAGGRKSVPPPWD